MKRTRSPLLKGRDWDNSAALAAVARQSRLVPVQSAAAVARPTGVETTWLEQQFDALVDEQTHEYTARGEQAAAPPSTDAAGLGPTRTALHQLIADNQPLVTSARNRFEHAKAALQPLVTRKAGSSVGYHARLGALLVGDVAGLGGAAISYGEVPALALAQAVSAGVATVTAGLVGSEMRQLQLANEQQHDPDTIPKELQPYRHLLFGPTASRKIITGVTAVAAIVVVCISVGIFTLRSSIEGTPSGLTFGLLAAGIAMASWINSYHHADAVADTIDTARHHYRRELRTHQRLAASRKLRLGERATERARLIRLQHAERGLAAAAKVEALKFEALMANPDIVGHGSATPSVGRKLRRGESV